MSVDALKSLKQGLAAAQRLAADETIPRRRELLSAWVVDSWTTDPATVVDPEYHAIFQLAPCPLPPTVLRFLFQAQHVPSAVLDSLDNSSYVASSLAADEWIAAFAAMLQWQPAWHITDLVWKRIKELSTDALTVKKIQAIDPAILEQGLTPDWRDRLGQCLFPLHNFGACPSGRLAALYIETMYKQRHHIFTQPTSSKLDYEQFVRSKLQERLLEPVAAAIKTFDSWTAYKETWRALHLAGREWHPLVELTEEAIRADPCEEAWAVALDVNAEMPSLVDLAIQNCVGSAKTFLQKTLQNRYEPDDIINRIVDSRNLDALSLLVDYDLVPQFEARRAAGAVDEMDYISRVWELRGQPVRLGPFASSDPGLLALLRIHILNGEPLENDGILLDGIGDWPEANASILIRYYTRCTDRDISDAILARQSRGECRGIVDDFMLHRWQSSASPANCAKLDVPSTLAATTWELAKFADAIIQQANEGNVDATVDVLSHIKGSRKLGGILVRAALRDTKYSRHVHLAQKHDVPLADIARVAYVRPDFALAKLLRPEEAVLAVCREMCNQQLSPDQVLCMAAVAVRDQETTKSLAKYLHGETAAICQAASILGKKVPLQRYLASTDTVDEATSVALAPTCSPVDALALLTKTVNPKTVMERLPFATYASLWLCPQLWPLLLACPRQDSGKLVTANMREMLSRPRLPILEALVSHRAALLRHSDVERICDHAAVHINKRVILLVTELFKQRPDLVADSANAITAVLVSAMASCNETTAASLARMLTLVLNRKTSIAFANHAPTVLLAHVRSVCAAALPLSTRLELEPGLFALCETMSRGRDRNRQGEGVSGIGLGEGSYGEAESEVWARLWNNFRRKTYKGRG